MKIELKKSVNFTNAQVGDVVFCVRHGVGKITQISPPTQLALQYPICVEFSDGVECAYTWAGKSIVEDTYATLYYYNPETQEILYSRPEPEINWAEYEGKLIEVRDKDEETWVRRRLCKYAAKIPKPFICYNSVESDVFAWKQARLIKEDSCE